MPMVKNMMTGYQLLSYCIVVVKMRDAWYRMMRKLLIPEEGGVAKLWGMVMEHK